MMPYREKWKLGEAIINPTVKHLNGIVCKLFLYLKILGVESSTVNCWLGEDASDD